MPGTYPALADRTRRRADVTDVLIVGAGSAGSILAERLSADPDRRVTVLEAGPGLDAGLVRDLTRDALSLPIGPESPVVGRYRTRLTDDPAREFEIVRGECVGGSGAVNGCYFWDASPGDFGAIPGWSWDDVKEHYRAVQSRIAASQVTEFSSLTKRFVAAAEATGHRAGVSAVPLNIENGRRCGPGAVFLEPALDRPNLTVLTGVRAHRLRFRGNRTIGVEAIGPAGAEILDAGHVVLTAGAIGTARLLLASGIGPSGRLADLPVGQRCWDHPEWTLPTGWTSETRRPVLEAVLNHEDLEIRPYTTGFGFSQTSIGVALMHPRARGRVTAERIEHRYDSAPADIAALRDGADLVSAMLAGVTPVGEPVWSTSQHLAGTAPMGTGDDAVVDPQLRVHGTEGLWVADGSVLPTPLSRGPHATIAMVGHRAADLLSSDL